MNIQDKIGRQDIVDKICGLVDSLQKDQNFCLSINGAWGSGKSFVLKMIEETLSKKQEYVIVKYDAWANSFYADPLIAILSCIIDGVDNKLYLVEQYDKKIKNAAKTTEATLAKISSKIKTLKEVVNGIIAIIKNFHNPIDTEVTSAFKSYQTLLKETKEVLNEITQKGEYREKQTKLIILVDEIDRCLPDEQLKILERMHHLFDIKNCAVICAINKDCISKSFNRIYDCDGNEYLRKFFDFNYKLDMGHLLFLKSLLVNDLLTKISKLCKVEIPIYPVNLDIIDKNVFLICYNMITDFLDKQNKEIDNRRVNSYYFSILNVIEKFGYDNLNSYNLILIVIGLFIEKFIDSDLLNPKIDRQDTVRMQKICNTKFLMHYIHVKTYYNNFYQCYEYDGENKDYYNMFDRMVREMMVQNDFNLKMNNQEFKGNYKELKQLMITYGGQDVSE